MNRLHLFMVVILLLTSFVSISQEKGNYFLKNFDPKESGLNAQTWTGIEDKNGVIYFASGNKISIYDGKSWNSIRLTNDAPPLSFCKDNEGIIYVGAVGELGYLVPNKQGKIEFVSLKKWVGKKQKDFQNIWSVEYVNGHVYFSSDQGIFDWDGKFMRFINKPVFFTFVKVKDKIYFNTKKEGLYVIDSKGVHRAKNGSIFINAPLAGGTKLNNNEVLFLSGNDGFVIYNEVTGELNKTKTNFIKHKDFIREAYVYSIERTINNKIAVGTIYKGIQLFDMNGNIENEITIEQGLINNAINKVFNDRFGNIWLCTDKGVSRVEINAGIKNWGLTHGIEGTIEDVIRFNGQIYIANSTAVMYLKDGKFLPVQGISAESWKFFINKGVLYVANSKGLYSIDGKTKNAQKATDINTIWTICDNPNGEFLALGSSNGIYLFNPVSKQIKQISVTQSPVRTLAYDHLKNLWFATDNKGVGYIDMNYKIHYLTRKNGLKFDSYNQIFKINKDVLIATKSGLYNFDYQKNSLKKFPDLGVYMTKDEVGVFRLKNDFKGNVYASTYGDNSARVSYINPKNKQRDTLAFKRLPKMHIYSFYGENNVAWLGTPDGLYKYDRLEVKANRRGFKALIRDIVIGKDSLLFAGNYGTKDKSGKIIITGFQHKNEIPKIKYDYNQMSFFFAAPYYSSEEKIVFQYKLEGFDEEWSDWTIDNFKNYTNLFEGRYTFLVRAQNIYGELSDVGKFQFRIRPPWYRSIFAYITYIILFVLVIYLVVRLYTRRLREANIRLENIVKERTAEVVRQKDLIEEKNIMITESIQYAKTIQEAIVTSNDYFKSLFSDVFILFKPKDIVSGDFYWAYRTKSNKIFWAAADCTGHGVPGAFMTMIGISLLNEIIIEKEIEETSEILDVLRDMVIKTLNKNIDLDSDEKMRNGMDISLCCWDLNTNQLQFSGANNPVMIYRKGELIEFKGDKQPIGIYKKMTPFTKQVVDLEVGDKIYTFSDGYADQMNEDENRFKIANLKKLIIDNGEKNIGEQLSVFDTTYESWKGSYDQMDDVVVLGVEIGAISISND